MKFPRRFGIRFPSVGPRRLGFSGITGVLYDLQDEFAGSIPAGSVNGTLATDGRNARTVTDTNSKISVGSGVLDFATGEAANDGVWYPVQTRTAGNVFVVKVTPANTTGIIATGWDGNQAGAILDALQLNATGGIGIVPNGGTSIVVGSYTATPYQIAGAMRATGILWFIKGGAFTSWTLLWATAAGTGNAYPAIQAQNAVSIFTSDFIRIPQSKVSFAPLASDSFNRADGAIGTADGAGTEETAPTTAWTGSTYTISTNKAINTPTEGAERIVNGTFDADTDWVKGTGWTIGSNVASSDGSQAANSNLQNSSATVTAVGTWYYNSYDVVRSAGSVRYLIDALVTDGFKSASGTYVFTARSTNAGRPVIQADADFVGNVDNVSQKALTLSTLFSSVTVSTQNVVAAVDIVRTAGTQSGLVLCLDSTSSPANFIIVYMDGSGNCVVDKCVGGTYTNVASTAVTYSAGASLVVSKDGNSVTVWYNNALVGSVNTVSDAGIVSNTKHGLFSTYSGNTFDNFRVWARFGIYDALNQFTG